jgi:solute:Na+ symporter, SSS family
VSFYKMIRPHAMGWQPVVQQGIKDGIITNEHSRTGRLATEILMMILGCAGIYALLFGTGYLIYGQMMNALMALLVAIFAAFGLKRLWSSID